MSIRVMSSVWEHSVQKGSRLLLLLAIADFARDDGVAWPSIKTLADMSRMSERQTARNVRDLVNAGELEVVKQGGSGARDTSMYRVIVTPNKGDKLSETAANKGDNMTPIDQQKGDTHDALKGDILGNKGDIAMSYEPLIDPSIEPPSITPDGESPSSDQIESDSQEPDPARDQPYPMLERVTQIQGGEMSMWTQQMLGRQLKVAKRLIGEGVTIAEVERCVGWLMGQKWVQSIDMFMIERKLGDFRLAHARTGNGPADGGTTRRGMSAKEALGIYYQGDE